MAWLDGKDESGNPIIPPGAESDTDIAGFTVLGVAHGSGDQHYTAEWSDDEQAYVWALEGPTARLTDAVTHQEVAEHGGGRDYGGPTWTALEDSSVVQCILAPGFVPEQLPDRIPALKLYSNNAYSGGIMGNVEAVQRLETQGGLPGDRPDADEVGSTQAIPYSATYVFWGEPPQPA